MSRSQWANMREQRRQLDALEGDDRIAAAVTVMHQAREIDLVRHAIGILGEQESADLHSELEAKYIWCEAQALRRDSGGYIRAALVRALRPISGPADIPILLRALLTYELDGSMEICGDLRAAALLAMNDIDPEIAASFSARYLHDPQVTFSGDPVTTAISILASHGNLAPVFGMVSWGEGRTDLLAEGLRSLVELPDALLPLVVERYIEREDEQIILGLFDLLLGHRTRDSWASTIAGWFRTTTVMDIYGVVAMQIVASRSEVLITMLRNLRADEVDRLRMQLLDQALALV